MESPEASVTKPADILFELHEVPSSWFFDLVMWFDGRCEETSGSRGAMRSPEDELMRAALMMLAGAYQADVWLDGMPGLAKLAFTAVWHGPSRSPVDLAHLDHLGCSVEWIECDEATGLPLQDRRDLGVIRSVRQFAQAALALGEYQYRKGTPTVALLALRAAVAALAEDAP